LIKYKGFQIAPAELEALILTMPQVTDVVVIPVVHEEAGEVPRAYVVPKAGTNVSEDEIIKFVESKVTHHKKLRGGVKFTDVIPKSASGKILRRVQILKDRESSSTK
jgi:4-coumarate--CoA ligase